jgi:hypothetical protein
VIPAQVPKARHWQPQIFKSTNAGGANASPRGWLFLVERGLEQTQTPASASAPPPLRQCFAAPS